ncbi:MAG: hydrogenase nickel incorporation protein HypB [Theionarchaea archaeon]|nr:hydrogenase nickel incorporation protein HypB [Theionarchaea archaeon]MBU7001274.1 hydrogenase nickel incorporation protein HypB [Theionarchaea archaeon]MBU7021371.1 hydrogenase nickel incorporation protein HypB [Theionarchaea archaeon]MBU7035983.1 hydrogenase nickel incorporation protein HypB [Theionarchaea archaeon]MBU7041708.1 hydrogenase nickel incorporation protein HypB [Theionarchaea archaeon]
MHFTEVTIGADLIQKNEELALRNRELLDNHDVRAFSIMGAIGSGKTMLIEHAIERLEGQYKCAVFAGDVIARYDAQRFEKKGALTVPLNTGKECHLDAHMVGHALEKINLHNIDLLFIENVGNLICPSDFVLGEHKRIVVVSVTEGDDTIAKHPMIFRISDAAVVNKIDIAQFVDADPDKMIGDARRINPRIEAIKTSCKTGEGLDAWITLLVG